MIPLRPGPAFQECTGYILLPWECSRPEGGIIRSGIDRWSDCIGPDRNSRHLGTLSTILQHFTHHETQWPTTTRWCHFALRDVSCGQSWHLSTPSHPRVPPEWPYYQWAQCGRYVVKHSRPPQMSASHLLGLQVHANGPSCVHIIMQLVLNKVLENKFLLQFTVWQCCQPWQHSTFVEYW